MPKLTKKFIANLDNPDKETVYWDEALPGFGLRHRKSGGKYFIAQYRNRAKRTRKVTIGQFGRITLDEARKEARGILGEVSRGDDPAEDKAQAGKTQTLAELANRYMAEHAEVKKKAKSIAQDRRMLDKLILPAMGRLRVEAITRRDIYGLHYKLKDTPLPSQSGIITTGQDV